MVIKATLMKCRAELVSGGRLEEFVLLARFVMSADGDRIARGEKGPFYR